MFSALRLLPSLFYTSALPWYFVKRPKYIILQYTGYSKAFLELLSITFLLRTFVSPWKSIVDEYPANKMNYSEIAQVFTLNCTTRIIGMMFRSVALLLAVALQLVLFIAYFLYIALWLAYPGVLIAALVHFSQLL